MWAKNYVTHIIDMFPHESTKYKQFIGNICESDVWEQVKTQHPDRFDFAICTHTLEDILNPVYVVRNMTKISKEGYVAMPSKWIELTFTGRQKGWLHHRWVFDVIDGVLICVPKLAHLEYMDTTSFAGRPQEIRFFWKDELPIKIFNDDYLGPNDDEYTSRVSTFLNH